MSRYVLAGMAGAAALAAVAVWAGNEGEEALSPAVAGPLVDDPAIDVGREVYAENCATCHGANLEGQADWQRRLKNGRMPAPPHNADGHTWHHAERQLFTITKYGIGAVVPGYESDMPAFEGILTDAEINAVLDYLKSTWPERERSFQAEVTANDKGGS